MGYVSGLIIKGDIGIFDLIVDRYCFVILSVFLIVMCIFR